MSKPLEALNRFTDRTAADDLADVGRRLGALVAVDQMLVASREELGGRTPIHLVATGQLRDVYALIRADRTR